MKEVLIIGAGDLGKEVVWLIEDINKHYPSYLILGFLDDDISKTGREFYGYKVLGTTKLLDTEYEGCNGQISAVIAIKDGKIREKIVNNHVTFKEWETIIHPNAVIASSSSIGKGSLVFPNVTVSVDTNVGDFSLLYIQAVVLNDVEIGKYVSVMANTTVADHKKIGDRTEIKR